MRLGKDAIKDFDCCCLSLQPCRDPVVTYESHFYTYTCFGGEIVFACGYISVYAALIVYAGCYWPIRMQAACVCLYLLTAVRMDTYMKKKPFCNTSFTRKPKLPRKWRFGHFLHMFFAPNVNVLLCLSNRHGYIFKLRHMRSRNRLWRVKASWSPSLRSDREPRSSDRERTTSSPSQSTPSHQVWKLGDKIKLKQWFPNWGTWSDRGINYPP